MSKTISLDELGKKLQDYGGWGNFWDGGDSKALEKYFEGYAMHEHASLVSGVRALEVKLAKIDAQLWFYDEYTRPPGLPEEVLNEAKEQLKYLRSARDFTEAEIERISKQYMIEIEG